MSPKQRAAEAESGSAEAAGDQQGGLRMVGGQDEAADDAIPDISADAEQQQ